jgi:hypothetical protein
LKKANTVSNSCVRRAKVFLFGCNLPNKVLATEYQTVLPDEKLIAEELERSRRELENRVGFAHDPSNP